MYGEAWLLFVTVLVLFADYCNSAFPRSNRGDPGGGVIVQLFRWRYEDIARECEEFLAPKGYGAVEVAPITEHWVISGKPPRWDEPYYPVSYNIMSRSGDEKSFKEMVQRCNKAGIKVYVSVVLAYMANNTTAMTGFGGSKADGSTFDYPAVPYDASDFNQPPCRVRFTNTIEQLMRTCDTEFDHHLNHTKPKVRRTLRNFLNKLISFGVAGFSVESVNRMYPADLSAIFNRLRYLNTSHGFACESEPYIYYEYDEVRSQNDKLAQEYSNLGRLAEYNYRFELNRGFYGYQLMSNLVNTINHLIQHNCHLEPAKDIKFLQVAEKGLLMDAPVVAEINQAIEDPTTLYCSTGFMLAYPFGQPRIASNYRYTYLDDAPPIEQILIAPVVLQGENCTGDWVCEHRWPAIYNMIQFRNVVGDANVTNVWHDGKDVLAFSRGDKGFVLFNGYYWYYNEFKGTVQTGLPKGEYCDVITGTLKDNKCTGKTISVDEKGFAYIHVPYLDTGMVAIHVQAKLK